MYTVIKIQLCTQTGKQLCKIREDEGEIYLDAEFGENFTFIWKGLIINHVPVKHIELVVAHGILQHATSLPTTCNEFTSNPLHLFF